MRRMQIQLTEAQVAALRQHADATGEGLAATVRDAVDEWIARRENDVLWERALSLSGKFHSGLHDVAENHDFYLGEGEW